MSMHRLMSTHTLDYIYRSCEKAGAAIMSLYEEPHAWDEYLKPDHSPVTAADFASHKILHRDLSKLSPDILIVSEEEIPVYQSETKLFWLVDPLDGTREFIARNDEFCITIALIQEGVPVIGIIYKPVDCYAIGAIKGKGLYHWIDTKLKKFSYEPQGHQELQGIVSRSHINASTMAMIDQLGIKKVEKQGSAIKFIRMLDGTPWAYPKVGKTMEWDIAAGHLILNEIGGELLSLPDGSPMSYGKKNWKNGHFLALTSKSDGVLIQDPE